MTLLLWACSMCDVNFRAQNKGITVSCSIHHNITNVLLLCSQLSLRGSGAIFENAVDSAIAAQLILAQTCSSMGQPSAQNADLHFDGSTKR